ncbi:MAG: hypothetical protein AW09_000741 [Candidatus Accumulibacter phosphatis]|uniref:Uncharacterized protein n=1 Tax=Candidatus Accumulibacter phosphatis TaxID=327160 RepID=A0A080MA33_9PROT|nr:MAG: hypothetical protein AW09_000741 [Candidatus Accumulibacter phosphatis]
MAAQHEGGDILDGDLELVGQEMAKARTVQHTGHADDSCRWQARDLLQYPDHGVQRIGDDDDKGLGAALPDVFAD